MRTLDDFTTATANGRIFSVVFIKRTTGETRHMNCRLGVKKHLAGGSLAFDPAAKKLLPVYDLQAEGYRMISLDSLVSVKLGGQEYAWINEAFVLKGIP